MKFAGFLALLLAAIVGIRAGVNFVQSEQERRLDVEQAKWAESCCEAVRETALIQAEKSESQERFDGIMAIVAAASLIGGIAMISKGGNGKQIS